MSFLNMEQENNEMNSEPLYPVLLIPKNYTNLEGDCDASENVFSNLNITSSDIDGNPICIYSGWCSIKLIDSYNVNSQQEPLDFVLNRSSTVPDEYNISSSALQAWIDSVENPTLDNLPDVQEQHSVQKTMITYERHTYISNSSETYRGPSSDEHKRYQKFNEQYVEERNVSYNNDDAVECGIILSNLHDKVRYEKGNKPGQSSTKNDALKQLMSQNMCSRKKTRTILYPEPASHSGETVGKVDFDENPVNEYENYEIYEDDKDLEGNSVQCVACNDIFEDFHEYEKHLTNNGCCSNTTKVNFICVQCGKKLKTKEKFESHCNNHGNPDVECSLCRKVFASKSTLKNHMKIHERKYPCIKSLCKKSFAKRKELVIHVAVTHQTFLCDFCNYNTSDYDNLKYHMTDHGKKQPAKTSPCFDNDLNDRNSNEEESNLILPLGHDDDCNDSVLAKVMSNEVFEMDSVKMRRYNKKLKVCQVCHKQFDRIGDLKIHLIEHVVRTTLSQTPVSPDGTLDIRCAICNAVSFGRVDKYKEHLREHAKLTIYKCTSCDKSFSDSSNFSKHKKIHGDSYFQCDLCSRKFNSKKSISQHMEYHLKNKPIRCEFCNKIFYFQSELNKHMKVSHIKDMGSRFRCRFCMNYYQTLKELWDHEWTKHKLRRMIVDCLVCGNKFRKYSELRKHCKKVHGQTIPNAKELSLKSNASDKSL